MAALGFLGVLKTVPWSDVIAGAPQVVAGARKLWDAVANRSQNVIRSEVGETPASDKITQIDATMRELQDQVLSASEIISQLANQNAMLIQKAEKLHIRLVCISIATGVSLLTAVASLIITLR
jgi:hypothetical protein